MSVAIENGKFCNEFCDISMKSGVKSRREMPVFPPLKLAAGTGAFSGLGYGTGNNVRWESLMSLV
jgi:hypothetical protein